MTRRQRSRRWRDEQIRRALGTHTARDVAAAFGLSVHAVYEIGAGIVKRGDFVWRGVRRRAGVPTRINGVPGVVAVTESAIPPCRMRA